MSQDEIERYYWKQAESYIDTLFDKGYFSSDTKREDMRQAEELLAFLFQSQSQSAAKGAVLLRDIKKSKQATPR